MITRELFGKTSTGAEVYAYTLNNGNVCATVLNLGGAIARLIVPDKNGKPCDVVCGYDDVYSYENADGYVGALIGRVGNRIAKGRFTLDGTEYTLYNNDGNNHLHGGRSGFDKKLWRVTAQDGEEPMLILSAISEDMEEGYPGRLEVEVRYTLTKRNGFRIEYKAKTSKRTPISLTNHAYFNLGGYASGEVFDHEMKIDADTYLPTDKELIPTGEIKSVSGTPFDFREGKAIGRDFDLSNTNLGLAGGYDHCLNFSDYKSVSGIRECIWVSSPKTGIKMTVATDRPAVQFYSGNFLDSEEFTFKGGVKRRRQQAFCLETQAMPDSQNHPNFTNIIIDPECEFNSTTEYIFFV